MLSKRFISTSAPLALLALAGMGLATAQSSSPFSSGNRVQAWEQPAAAPTPALAPALAPTPALTSTQNWQAAPTYAPPSTNSGYSSGHNSGHNSGVSADAPIATNPRQTAPAAAPVYGTYSAATPPKTYSGQSAPSYSAPAQAGAYQPPAARSYAPQAAAKPMVGASVPPTGTPYNYTPPARQTAQARNFGSATPPTGTPSPTAPRYGSAPNSASPYAGRSYAPPTDARASSPQAQNWGAYQAQSPTPPTGVPPTGVPPTGSPYPGGPYTPAPQRPRSWKEKLGLNNLATVLRGAFTLGAAATNREQAENQFGPDDGWSEDFIGDANVEFEVSAITQDGLEYGVNLGGRAQYDPYRRGFGGRLPDGASTLRGHTSGFYAAGDDLAEDTQFALESAHLFLRSAYGDVTVGRDDGAAYLFSLGAPTLLAVGASNSPVDYTGYDSVKTVNDASGFAEKITYTSPRLLGDQIGVGVQLGVSYALDGNVCGVDYCNGKTLTGVDQPNIEDILEVGLALDRTFENGLSVELTGTYARGSETSGLAGLNDLESFGTGLEFGYGDWTVGGSYLQSNNGLLNGDYTAYDAGITWKPGALGFTLGYGHAEDENVGLKSDQGTFGITYDFNKFTVGTGVQYVDRDVSGFEAGLPTTLDQKATSIFVQGGFKF